MERFSLEDLQEVEYYMLCKLEKICQEIPVKMCLDYGTLLGAVRHKGFIPWDDDIDVYMNIKDYRKLRRYFKKHHNHIDGLFLADYSTDHETFHCLPRIRLDNTQVEEWQTEGLNIHKGFWIDIFTHCNYGRTALAQKLQKYLLGTVFMLHEKYVNRHKKETGVEVPSIPIYKLSEKMPEFLRTRLIGFLLFVISCLGSKKSGTDFIMCMHVNRRIIPQKYISETVKLPFGKMEFNVSKDYDGYLRLMYGDDYMTPVQYHEHFQLPTVQIDEETIQKIKQAFSTSEKV